MTNTIIATLALVVSAGLSWAGAPEGKEVYTAKCAPCHGANGEGKAAIAKMYNVTQRPLASKEVQARTDEELKQVILKGQGKMKPVAGVTEKQAADVVAFVRTLK
jgi:mono/diheme cytochrome c family protein